MDNNVIQRLQNYCANHQELINMGIIKGINSITNDIVLEKDGVQKNVSMDILENNKFDFNKFEIISTEDEIETLEELTKEIKDNNSIPKNMSELKEAIKNKDEKAINKVLETFAINEDTGVIDINKAISIVTSNAIKEAVDCIINNKDFDNDMTKYDVTGRKVALDE